MTSNFSLHTSHWAPAGTAAGDGPIWKRDLVQEVLLEQAMHIGGDIGDSRSRQELSQFLRLVPPALFRLLREDRVHRFLS
ncbi:hypothetical protein [Streptomyces sp. A5-4]|uniref:hypothetical protein n=1 Tax=Streptomyces sp. A5-4 TaxID=3384771 RepID=UPI003DA7F2FC